MKLDNIESGYQMALVKVDKKAIIIESGYQMTLFKKLCAERNISIAKSKISTKSYPIWEMCICTGSGIFAIPNEDLDKSDISVVKLGYTPITLAQFKNNNF